ncbi:hypothetical protein SPOG_02078 [Schizosaccharomyces cryophilus OY26]|uniref:Uncharacterized protein n=1 Tax=Schizosaccharomyces cryophilus (strain OY26 / ATCC MYA-4695 / CBS 11777 / NBRC 106824 / NRRL Y48691) TaxID=653667 RepID=S9W2P0_SCHCR|nr:uncharacterized protein SPOG_02078 [Schizosaccharomyces cryophilus OY26]EPY52759.1 hypothetical protein SPOG_02078 [Schizosaccharomyces cryophilus OY26]
MDSNDCVLSLIDELEQRQQTLSRLQAQLQQAFLQLSKKKAQHPSYAAQLPAAVISKYPRCFAVFDAMEESSSKNNPSTSSSFQIRLQSHPSMSKPFSLPMSFDIVGHDFLSCLQDIMLLCKSNKTIQSLLESMQKESSN